MKEQVFQINSDADMDLVWQELEEAGCQLLYSMEEEDSHQIFGFLPKNISAESMMTSHPQVKAIGNTPYVVIDWESQWALHGADYRDGYVHVNMAKFAPENPQELRMKPGPGFGDLSHPTTRLVLMMMEPVVKGRHVIDVGCGSGILSLAAISMGAASVIGVDIDPLALDHARENAALNEMSDRIDFFLPDEMSMNKDSYVVLMNMIASEQSQAWDSLKEMHPLVTEAVTSGILVEARQEYIQQCKKWGWQLIAEQEEDGWLGIRANCRERKEIIYNR